LVLVCGVVLKALPFKIDPWESHPHDSGLMDAVYYHWEASLIWSKLGDPLEKIKFNNVSITAKDGFPVSNGEVEWNATGS